MRKIYATITKTGNGKSGLTVSQKLSVISQHNSCRDEDRI